MVHVHGLQRTEAIQSLQLVDGSGESVDSLQEGVVGQLEGRVQRDRRGQGFASHRGEGRHSSGLIAEDAVRTPQ